MSVHFSAGELASRGEAAAAELARRGLDGLLMFRQESMYRAPGEVPRRGGREVVLNRKEGTP